MTPKPKKASEPPPNPFGQWIREYRFLAYVVAVTMALAVYEVNSGRRIEPSSDIKPESILNYKRNMPDVLTELYPERNGTHYWVGYQAALCMDRGFTRQVCRKFPHQNINDVREEFERALATGEKSNEELLLNYADILVQLGESEDEINKAIRNWRINFPHSKNPTPRQVEETERQDSPALRSAYP